MEILTNTLRLLGVQISTKKKIYIALTAIYGIGILTSIKILKKLNINSNLKLIDLTKIDIVNLTEIITKENFKFEGHLKRIIGLNIKRLIEIKSFRGWRHLKGLPTRGQRTRTNSRTCRNSNLFSNSKKPKIK